MRRASRDMRNERTTLTGIVFPLIAVVILMCASRPSQAQTLESGSSPGKRAAFIDEDGDGINDIRGSSHAGNGFTAEKKEYVSAAGAREGRVKCAPGDGDGFESPAWGIVFRGGVERFDEDVNCSLLDRFRFSNGHGMFGICDPVEGVTIRERGARRCQWGKGR